jgi:DNA-binding CsgD family transcriptional regulator
MPILSECHLMSSRSSRVEQLLRELRLPHQLSPREMQVALHGAQGLDTKSIATELGLSPKTVDELWRRLYKKFDCRSRQEIVARLLASALEYRGRAAVP